MQISQLLIDGFWTTATGLVPLIVPMVGVFLVFRIIKDVLLD